MVDLEEGIQLQEDYEVSLYVLNISGLSVWSQEAAFTFSLFGFPVDILTFAFVELFVHFAVFYVACVGVLRRF